MMRSLVAIFLSFALVQTAAAVPPEFTAHYLTKKYGIGGGVTEISFKEDDGFWHYRSFTRPQGLATLFIGDKSLERRALLKLENEKLIPLEYHYVQTDSDKNRDEHYKFDWENKQLSANSRGQKIDLALEPEATDVFSLELKLIQDVAEGAADFQYKVIDGGEWETYEYMRLSREAIDTKFGRLEVIPLQRKKDNRKKTTYTVWFAPQLNYLPVKFEKREKGKVVLELELESVEWEDARRS